MKKIIFLVAFLLPLTTISLFANGQVNESSESNYIANNTLSINGCAPPTTAQNTTSSITQTTARLNCSASGTYRDFRYRTSFTWTNVSHTKYSYKIISGLTPGTTYYWQSRVYCNGQWSAWSNLDSFTTSPFSCSPPTASQNYTSNITGTSARLNCSAAGTNRDFQYRVSGTTSWTDLTSTVGNSKTISGLSNSTTYQWRSRRYCPGWSVWSSIETFTTSSSTCSAPTTSQNSTSYITSTSARLTSTASGAYREFRYFSNPNPTWTYTPSTSGTYRTITGLTPGTLIYWQSRVYCTSGVWSSWSSNETFTTSAGCGIPTASQNYTNNITSTSARLNTSATGSYKDFQYRASGTSTWTNVTQTSLSYKNISGLNPSTTYQWRSRVYCTSWTSYSVIETFTTLGGGCTPATPTASEINNSNDIYCTYAYAVCNGHTGDYKQFQLRNQSTGAYTYHYTTSHNVFLGNLTPGTPYRYKVRIKCGTSGSYGAWSPFRYFTTTTCLSGDSEAGSASKKSTIGGNSLRGNTPSLRNYPNPFNGVTTIEFELPEETDVSLFVSDITGKRVAILVNNELRTSGLHLVTFDGSNLPSGVYHYTILAGDQLISKKLIISK